MDEREWYSVKCIFEHDGLAKGAEETVYEERVVILRAADFDDAIEQGEAEARDYAESIGDGSICYVGFISAYRTGERRVANRMEVYSLMRQTNLSREEFVTHYYDDGNERTQHYEEESERTQ